jgi:hypothetical protein
MERMEGTALRFAEAARSLGDAARSLSLTLPAFRSPPRLADAPRTVRRRAGGVTIAVRLRGRPWPAVLADMVEGVIVANGLTGPAAAQARSVLWAAVAGHDAAAAA